MFASRKLRFRVFVAWRRWRIGFDLKAIKGKLFLRWDDRCWNFEWNGISSHGRCHARRSYFCRRRPVVSVTRAAATVLSLALYQKLYASFDELRPGLRIIKIFPLIVSDSCLHSACVAFKSPNRKQFAFQFKRSELHPRSKLCLRSLALICKTASVHWVNMSVEPRILNPLWLINGSALNSTFLPLQLSVRRAEENSQNCPVWRLRTHFLFVCWFQLKA